MKYTPQNALLNVQHIRAVARQTFPNHPTLQIRNQGNKSVRILGLSPSQKNKMLHHLQQKNQQVQSMTTKDCLVIRISDEPIINDPEHEIRKTLARIKRQVSAMQKTLTIPTVSV